MHSYIVGRALFSLSFHLLYLLCEEALVKLRSCIGSLVAITVSSWADPGYVERGFRCVKEGGSLCWFYLIFLKYTMKMK